MTQRDWQKDMEMAHTARYEHTIIHLNNVLDSLFYWLGAYGGLESAYEKQIVEAGKYSERADAAEAREQHLKPEIGKCMVAGNSLGSVIMSYNLPSGHEEWTFQQASAFFYETYERETAYERYEIWLAWTAIIKVSQNLSTLYPDTPAQEGSEDET